MAELRADIDQQICQHEWANDKFKEENGMTFSFLVVEFKDKRYTFDICLNCAKMRRD
jgi:hypothetical protein